MPSVKIVRSIDGRALTDVQIGTTYLHRREVTISEAMVAQLEGASLVDREMPLFSSSALARASGFSDRPLHPIAALNLTLQLAAPEEREPAALRFAYLDVRYPDAGYVGDNVSACSTVVEIRPTEDGRGILRVRTILQTDDGRVLCAIDREALATGGRFGHRPPRREPAIDFLEMPHLPPSLTRRDGWRAGPRRAGRAFEDFTVGQVVCHEGEKSIDENEPAQLAAALGRDGTAPRRRVVSGGLVLGWALALGARDLTPNALWDLGLIDGAHPQPVVVGDTIAAASRVVGVRDAGAFGAVTVRVVGVKNRSAASALAEHGPALFEEERNKAAGARIEDKVVEVTRTLAVRKR
jgi:2-methylfumaryl-CoA hydratase